MGSAPTRVHVSAAPHAPSSHPASRRPGAAPLLERPPTPLCVLQQPLTALGAALPRAASLSARKSSAPLKGSNPRPCTSVLGASR